MLYYAHILVNCWKVDRMGADTSVVKKKNELNPMAWMEKHRDMQAKGEKAMDTKTGGRPGYLSQSQ